MKFLKLVSILLLFFGLFSCQDNSEEKPSEFDINTQKSIINANLDLWHHAAANANFDGYFNLMTDDAVFIGTDATENWQNDAFKTFSKPYFDKGKAWSFTSLQRHIYLSDDLRTGWFDELLNTQMGLCRGSGIMKLEDDEWKIAHYVLSISIPNDQVNQTVKLKEEFDSLLINELTVKQ